MIDPDAFLRQEVETASPAKLRWLLIRKAIGLCQAVSQLWSEDRNVDALQWLLRIREILCELLDGVTDRKNPAAGSVSDLYVFLIGQLGQAESHQHRPTLQNIIDILQIELETWGQFVQRENQRPSSESMSVRGSAPSFPSIDSVQPTEWAGLNFEA